MCGRYQHNRRKSFALLEIFDALTRLLHITRDIQKNIKKSNVLKIHKENARHKKQYGISRDSVQVAIASKVHLVTKKRRRRVEAVVQ